MDRKATSLGTILIVLTGVMLIAQATPAQEMSLREVYGGGGESCARRCQESQGKADETGGVFR